MVSYRIGGKNGARQKLKEADDLVVVRFTDETGFDGMSLDSDRRTLINNLMLVEAMPEANVKIYRCNPLGEKSAKQVRNAVRKMAGEMDDIKFSGRVLVDDKGVINIYTENIFIKFHDEVTEEACKELIKKHNLEVKKAVKYAKNAFFVTSAEKVGKEIFPLAEELLDLDRVELCHPEIIKQKKYKQQVYPQQWHLTRTTFMTQEVNAHVEVEQAWQHTMGEGIVVAVIDDAIDIDHPEFEGTDKVVHPRDMFSETDNPRPSFPNQSHGTSCAGVVCASGLDKAAGVAPLSTLMPIKLNANLGSMQEADAFVWAADHGADVISCSWGPQDGAWWDPSDPSHTNNVPLPDSTRLAIDYAVTNGRNGKGCIITWAAGNGRENTFFDGYASYEKVLAIAACNDTGKRSVYSDFGREVFCSFPSGDQEYPLFDHPRPITPGIWTTDIQGQAGYNGGSISDNPMVGDAAGNYTATFGGTSSACPGAAGVIALVLSVNPDLNLEGVKDVIRQSCDQIDIDNGNYDTNGHSIYYGYGRINALKAVENALQVVTNV